MSGDVVEDVKADVGRVVSAKTDRREERVSGLLSWCAKEASVREVADAVKALLAGVETRFREEHTVLVEAIRAQTASAKAQTSLLEVLCCVVKAMNARVDVLCSHASRLENIERDVAAIKNAFQVVEDKVEAVSSFISKMNDHVDDISLVFREKINEIKKGDEERRKGKETMTVSFSGKDLDVMVNGVEVLKKWTGKGSAAIVYDSTVDEFTDQGLFDKVEGKANVAVIGFTTDGDVFGGFYSRAVTEQWEDFYDPSIFAFSFESHGRCMTPQRFVVYGGNIEHANVEFSSRNSHGFVMFWVERAGGFWVGNEKTVSFCRTLSLAFDKFDATFISRDDDYPPKYSCNRIIAVQLSN